MTDRKAARLAAPLALVAAAIAVAIVVQASSSSSPTTGSAAPRTVATQPARHVRARPHFYTVKAGDTLTVIADDTGVSLDTIQRLNPQVDPQALQTGQRLKLSP